MSFLLQECADMHKSWAQFQHPERKASFHRFWALLLLLPFFLFLLCFSFFSHLSVSTSIRYESLFFFSPSPGIPVFPPFFSVCIFLHSAFYLSSLFAVVLTSLSHTSPFLSLSLLLYDTFPSYCGCLGGQVITV